VYMAIHRGRLLESLSQQAPGMVKAGKLSKSVCPLDYLGPYWAPIFNWKGQIIYPSVRVTISPPNYLTMGTNHRPHRIKVVCPNCLSEVPAGRFGQHIHACLKKHPRVCRHCGQHADDLTPCGCGVRMKWTELGGAVPHD